MRRGSITVFLALTLVLILSFVFAMLESARLCCLQAEAGYMSRLCTQSAFANYHRGLWEDYHLLLFDGSQGQRGFSVSTLEGRAMAEAERNLEADSSFGTKGQDLLRFQCQDVSADSYLLVTDGKGRAFLQEVCRQMMLEIPVDALEELKSQKEQSRELEKETKDQEERWDQAWDALEEAQEIAQEEQAEGASQETEGRPEERAEDFRETAGGPKEGAEDFREIEDEMAGAVGGAEEQEPQENPMEYVEQLKASSLLSLVLPKGTSLSAKGLDQEDSITKRSLEQGTMEAANEKGIQDLTLWYYMQQYFSCFTEKSAKGPKERCLDYEMEYLIGGKKTDGENLEKVVGELLALREAMNFATLMGDTAKKQQAMALATALVGFTGIAPLVLAVQIGILLAWAFVESVLDVRALLEGGKISLLKRPGEWSSDIGHCRETIEGQSGAGEDERGLSYGQYLLLLLFLHSAGELSFRCMALMEQNEQIRMDHMIVSAKLSFTYGAKPLFWNLNLLKGGSWESLTVSGEGACSYVGGYPG